MVKPCCMLSHFPLNIAMNLKGALNCLANGPDKDLNQAAREMVSCGIDIRSGDNAVVLLPTSEALSSKLEL